MDEIKNYFVVYIPDSYYGRIYAVVKAKNKSEVIDKIKLSYHVKDIAVLVKPISNLDFDNNDVGEVNIQTKNPEKSDYVYI
jgi:hypothetical protein